MNAVQLLPCECPEFEEVQGYNYAVSVDPVKLPGGTPAHNSDAFLCSGIWIQNPHATLTLYFGFGAAPFADLTGLMKIYPGQDKFWGVVTEAEKLVSIPRLRIRPYKVRLQGPAAMTAVVVLFA